MRTPEEWSFVLRWNVGLREFLANSLTRAINVSVHRESCKNFENKQLSDVTRHYRCLSCWYAGWCDYLALLASKQVHDDFFQCRRQRNPNRRWSTEPILSRSHHRRMASQSRIRLKFAAWFHDENNKKQKKIQYYARARCAPVEGSAKTKWKDKPREYQRRLSKLRSLTVVIKCLCAPYVHIVSRNMKHSSACNVISWKLCCEVSSRKLKFLKWIIWNATVFFISMLLLIAS